MTNKAKSYSVVADMAKNRLYITISEAKLTKKNLDNLYTDIRFYVADLKPDFDVITDVSACSLGALNGLPTFNKIADFLVDNKVGKVIRVVDEQKVLFKQFLNITAKMQGYSARYVNSLAEAEEELNKP